MLAIQSCSSLVSPNKKVERQTISDNNKKANSHIKDFDQKTFPNKHFIIANMIAIVQPELNQQDREKISVQISKALKKHKIDPQIMVAIIDTESNFQANKISSTGDLSVAQINPEIWNKELIRMKQEAIDKEKLKKDQEYALIKMAQILEIIKNRHSKKDRKWYARYHSNTKDYKKDYLQKLDIRLKMLALAPDLTKKSTQQTPKT